MQRLPGIVVTQPRVIPRTMKRSAFVSLLRIVSQPALAAAVLSTLFVSTALAAAPSDVMLWDSGAAFSSDVNVTDRSAWKPVPTDLLSLEADPPKARSDPGYYGREYSFEGDAVVEPAKLFAAF